MAAPAVRRGTHDRHHPRDRAHRRSPPLDLSGRPGRPPHLCERRRAWMATGHERPSPARAPQSSAGRHLVRAPTRRPEPKPRRSPVAHPYRIREIAVQAGLSERTVDRVLNNRGHVRESTVREVQQAIADLDRQRSQLRLGGRIFMIDVVMQAPQRFSSAVREGLEATLDRIRSRGSHGVILKAPDVPEIITACWQLIEAGIPIVTLVTDLLGSQRLAYIGMDNRAAGATAAYLMGQWLGDRPGDVLVTLSRGFFRGEEEREIGFQGAMRTRYPGRAMIEIDNSDGLDETMRGLVLAALDSNPNISAVYSIGGGNMAIVEAFAARQRSYSVFIAHDLDQDNTRLLRAGRISAVLHHDLRQDMRQACYAILQANKALPGVAFSWPSNIHIVTPYNMPPPALSSQLADLSP